MLQDCNEEVRKVFQEAEGDTEFTVDGVFINIRNTDGTHYWAEVKVADFVKRPRGESVLPQDWCHRNLPKPPVNMVIATLCKIEEFTEDCKEFRFNFGVGGNVLFKDEASYKTWFEDTRMLLLRNGNF